MLIYICAITIIIVVLGIYMIKPPSNWVPSIGKIGKDGRYVYMGNGNWKSLRRTDDGRQYLNPITNEVEFIPGIISADKTTVYTGAAWIPVTLSPDGKWYLNPVTNTYAPVKYTHTDFNGEEWVWNLFDSQWEER